jgi:hypothetical protein
MIVNQEEKNHTSCSACEEHVDNSRTPLHPRLLLLLRADAALVLALPRLALHGVPACYDEVGQETTTDCFANPVQQTQQHSRLQQQKSPEEDHLSPSLQQTCTSSALLQALHMPPFSSAKILHFFPLEQTDRQQRFPDVDCCPLLGPLSS